MQYKLSDLVLLIGNTPQLDYASTNTHIPALRNRGVTVSGFTPRVPTTLEKISGDDQQGVLGGTLAAPLVVRVLDAAGNPFKGVPVTYAVTTGGGTLSTTETTTDTQGQAETILTLGTSGTQTVKASVVVDTLKTLTQTFTMILRNVRPAFSSAAAFSVPEHTTDVGIVAATDPDAGDTATYAISGGGDRAAFAIHAETGALTFNTAPDFEAPGSAAGNNVYAVQVTASSGTGDRTLTAVQAITVTVEDVVEPREDVNQDGQVNVNDLVLVAAGFGQTVAGGADPNLDVNEDGTVDGKDVNLVLAVLEAEPAAAPAHAQTQVQTLQHYLEEAKQLNRPDPVFQRGIRALELLIETLLVPKETVLLANYPNPFNPETWIPYQLATAAEVTLHIYGVDGTLVRTLQLGHQAAGVYKHRSRASYWDGRNAVGERVASGVYFYTLIAGDQTATRKMLIRK